NSPALVLLRLGDDNALLMNARSVARGKTARHLVDLGYEVAVIQGGIPQLSATSLTRLSADIDNHARRVGGARLLSKLLSDIASRYDPRTDRYLLLREGKTVVTEPELQKPWGYIFQLAVRHFHEQTKDGSEAAYAQLLRLVTLAVALLDVQQYGSIENMYLRAGNIVAFLRNSVVYDSLFTLPQAAFRHIEIMYHGLITQTKFDSIVSQGMPMTAIVEISDAFLRLSNKTSSRNFTATELAQKTKRSRANVINILDRVFAHPMAGANSALSFPPRSTQVDSGFRPLLKLDAETYVCPPTQISGPAALEALLAVVRQEHKNADGEIGTLVEDVIRSQFARRGVSFKCGDYDASGDDGKMVHGECDIVVETASKIIFFEVKKKPLTRAARSGDDISILGDMAKGLLSSQLQALGHEELLRKHSKLTLLRNGVETELAQNGREIFRVSVVFLDFGSIQDRQTFQQFMKISCFAKFDAVDRGRQSELDKLQKGFIELKEIGTRLGELTKTFPFENSYFLSIPQLLLLLEKSTGADSLVDELLRTRRMITPLRDFYGEYVFAVDLLGAKRPKDVAAPSRAT
ncbi:hypothetical protein, partial [Paraburkholderia sediminicola]|uniref:hypothetical protein n=1 Tax=Paraburkholderia sediminicola TaxID=458836 RepID=UPI0038B8F167